MKRFGRPWQQWLLFCWRLQMLRNNAWPKWWLNRVACWLHYIRAWWVAPQRLTAGRCAPALYPCR